MIIGQILTVAAAAIAIQVVLPSIWSGFQAGYASAAAVLAVIYWRDTH